MHTDESMISLICLFRLFRLFRGVIRERILEFRSQSEVLDVFVPKKDLCKDIGFHFRDSRRTHFECTPATPVLL